MLFKATAMCYAAGGKVGTSRAEALTTAGAISSSWEDNVMRSMAREDVMGCTYSACAPHHRRSG